MAARKLGFVMTDYPRLAQTFIANEIAELRALGYEITPFALNGPADADVRTEWGAREAAGTFYIKPAGALAMLRSAAATFARHPMATTKFVAEAMRGNGADLKAIVWRGFHIGEAMIVRDQCRRVGISHLHAQFGQATASVAWMAHELDVAVADGSLTWSFTIHGFQEFTNEQRSQLDRKAASASFVACISDFTRAQLMRLCAPELWDRLHVVRVGIDFAKFPYTPRAQANATPRVLIVGRLSPEKGHNVLIDAMAALRRRGIRVETTVVGDGDHRAGIEEHARRVGVRDAMTFTGELSPAAVADELENTDVFCLPSFSEGIPVSIMEAMALGRPVVTTYVNGIPELAVNRETAMVVPAGNADALADALATLVADESLRGKLTANALVRVRANHEIRTNVARMAALFDRACGVAA